MSVSSEANPEETLAQIYANLKSENANTRLRAIQVLLEQKFSSEAILYTLEQMALKDKSKPVREAARGALDSPTHRYIRSRTSNLKRKDRQAILNEIETWESQGLIQRDQADIIRTRYDFDLKPDKQAIEPAHPSKPEPAPLKPAASISEQSPAPQAGLTQTLLSETSIKIALYLGAFFVIAAAAILAAIVEAARIPILLISTALFAGGAIITRKRLPQPSFALFVVFSFLLPTDANVLADVLNLSDKANSGYWFVVMAIMALIWGFGTWFYASRLFSLAAFFALGISVFRLGEFFEELEIYLILFNLATMVGLGGAYLLKRWQSQKFSLPLFLLVQIAQLSLNAFGIIAVLIRFEDFPSTWNLASTFFWFLTAGFYVLSNLAFEFVLFPWLAALALYPIPLTFMLAFDVEAIPVAIASWIWGALLAFGSEMLRHRQRHSSQSYVLPLLIVSIPVVLTAILLGMSEDIAHGFTFLLGSAILYAVLQVLKPRLLIWVTSLLFGLGAYFSFFALPFMENFDVFGGYQLLGASLFLLLPDLLKSKELFGDKTWRWPLRIFGGIFVFLNGLALASLGLDEAGKAALVYIAYAIFFVPYALRHRKAWLGYLATTFAALSITYALQHFETDNWPLILTALSALYYLAGFILSRDERQKSWSDMLRHSGLGLSSIVSLAAVVTTQESNGWYALITALFFGVEMFSGRGRIAEAGIQLFLATGTFSLLNEANVAQNYQWLGVSLVLLGTDLVLARTYNGKRPTKWFSRGFGGIIVLFNTLHLLSINSDSQVSATCFAVYMLFFLVQAVSYRLPLLGYGFTFYSVTTVITTLLVFEQDNWLLPVTALAFLYYALGYFLRKRYSDHPEHDEIDPLNFDWPFVLWTSGLGAGLLATFVAPIQGGLSATIPVAVTATFITVEAFDRRNVWLGFPANALYLMAYFILLVELNVDEPQFFSIATAALGLLMHYLLARAGSRTGAFITGMVSQLVLLGTTYIQFLSTERLLFFAIMFFQALVVLLYGVVIRSRSLVITPIVFAVLSVLTVLYGLLEGILPVLLIGCTGLILLMLGILAVVMRDRIKQISERFNDWGA